MIFRRSTTIEEAPTVTEEDLGTPLPEYVIAEILEQHRQRVPASVAFPMPGLVPNAWSAMPPVPKAYATGDGRYVGSPISPAIAEHAAQLVVINDNKMPSADELRRIRVYQDGTVRWET
jgi:hypothetical protein